MSGGSANEEQLRKLEARIISLEQTRAIVIAVAAIFGIAGGWGWIALNSALDRVTSLDKEADGALPRIRSERDAAVQSVASTARTTAEAAAKTVAEAAATNVAEATARRLVEASARAIAENAARSATGVSQNLDSRLSASEREIAALKIANRVALGVQRDCPPTHENIGQITVGVPLTGGGRVNQVLEPGGGFAAGGPPQFTYGLPANATLCLRR